MSPPTKPVWIEGIPVHGFKTFEAFFQHLLAEIATEEQSIINYLNVHVANQVVKFPWLKRVLRKADIVFCDGAGIVVASRMLGQPLPCRFTAADWFVPFLALMAEQNQRVYLLGGAPGVPEKTLDALAEQLDEHPVIGAHHGFILEDDALEQQVIDEINRLQPDLLVVGFGTPLQEFWIDSNRHRLKVSAIMGLGAVMDFVSGTVNRCPQWMGENGLEWLYRLFQEPGRMFDRYVMGNPWFLTRIAMQAFSQRFSWGPGKAPLPSS